jgi:hypothetical protein
VYPTFEETTARAIETCEAAWTFFGGVFAVLIPDNTKAIITTADALHPRITPTFREYAQARGFHIDAARVRHPQDKGRVERAVPTVRDDCFAGEALISLDDARLHAERWCRDKYGLRRHGRTQRRPRGYFELEERPYLRPAPTGAYRPPALERAEGRAHPQNLRSQKPRRRDEHRPDSCGFYVSGDSPFLTDGPHPIGGSGLSTESPLCDASANSRVEHGGVRPTPCTSCG